MNACNFFASRQSDSSPTAFMEESVTPESHQDVRRYRRRARAFDDYCQALRRYVEALERRSREMTLSTPSRPQTQQELDDARIIWAASRWVWVGERLT